MKVWRLTLQLVDEETGIYLTSTREFGSEERPMSALVRDAAQEALLDITRQHIHAREEKAGNP